jgi:hypothetical protein
VLLRELRPLGVERSYQTLTRELRRLGRRPECPVCKRGGHRLTIELSHEPGEELQLDWLELTETPWGEPAYPLVGALSHSGRIRSVISESMDFGHLVATLDRVLRRSRRHHALVADGPDGDDRRASDDPVATVAAVSTKAGSTRRSGSVARPGSAAGVPRPA